MSTPSDILTIANLETHYYVPHGAPEPAQIRARLDRLIQQRLPQAVGDALLPAASDENAVYRIRQLELRLWFDNVTMSESELVERAAALTIRTLTQGLLYGSASNVVRFDDHAHYIATFLGDLLAGQAWSRWLYEEFAPLRNLPTGQIAAQLLGARPELLIPVARRLSQARQLEPLILRLQLADIRLLLRDGLGFAPPPAIAPGTPALAEMLRLIAAHSELERKADPVTLARNTLRSYLAVAMQATTPVDEVTLLAVAYHLALILSLWSARPAPVLWQALARQEIATAGAIDPLLATLGDDWAQAKQWLAAVLENAAGQRYLAQLIGLALPEVSQPAQESARPGGLPAERINSGFAGLALLLPVIRDLQLQTRIGNEGVYQLLLAGVGRTLRPLAWGDEAIAWLAGIAVEDMATARVTTIDWQVDTGSPAIDAPTTEPVFALATAVIGHFARGLRGFAHSSPDFIAENFLNLSGVLVRREQTLEVHLNRAPLAIVLQMAGRVGEQGAIPWLDDRTLHIFLPAG